MDIVEVNMNLLNLMSEIQEIEEMHEAILKILEYGRKYYDADCCCELSVAPKLDLWMPVFRRERQDLGKWLPAFDTGQDSWKDAMEHMRPVVITDIESIRDTYPAEYSYYVSNQIHNLIGVPIQSRQYAFFLVCNSRRHEEEEEYLIMLGKILSNLLRKMDERDASGRGLNGDLDRVSGGFGQKPGNDGSSGTRLLQRNSDPDETGVEAYNESGYSTLFPNESMLSKDSEQFEVEVHLFGNIEVYANGCSLKESDNVAPLFWRLFVFLVLNRTRSFKAKDLVEKLQYDTDTDQKERNIRSIMGRIRKKCKEALGVDLVISHNKNGYQINPACIVHTDCEMFERYRDQAAQADNSDEKIWYLSKAADLYKGVFFANNGSAGEFSTVEAIYSHYYVRLAMELLEELEKKNEPYVLQKYAAMAISVEPYEVDFYKYLYIGVFQTRGYDSADEVLESAYRNLTQKQYEELVSKVVHVK